MAKPEAKKKLRLGDILLQQNIITEAQLEQAFEHQKRNRAMRIGDCLIECGFITGDDIVEALHLQLGIEKIDLRTIRIQPDVISLVSGSILRKHSVLPIAYDENDNNTLILAMADPLDMTAQDDIAIITNCMIEPRVASHSSINGILDRYFGSDEAMSAAEQYKKEREIQLQEIAELAAQDEADVASAPIVQLVRSIIEQAVRQRASDIHFEALEKQVRIRYRIDGVLAEKMMYDIALLPAITARIKILSGLDISEKRKPQDGRITIHVDRAEYDIRVSVMPSSYGEKTVMRLASKTGLNKDKSELGMKGYELKKFEQILTNPHGIFLVTGPTGSGKSTTLYTALSELNTEGVNIVTVEDPVEANIPGINQTQVNVKAGITFATALRAFLRQDPDIIMVGEIRDTETASIAVQASITGHLVVSTLHTNSSSATVTRLLDMGIESFLLADSLVGIIAQRLVRRLCTQCKKSRPAEEHEKKTLKVPLDEELMIYEPVGCHACNETGFFGRIGVYEIMEITPKIRSAITAMVSTDEINKMAIEEGMVTLRAGATQYVIDGITSISEMLEVSMEE